MATDLPIVCTLTAAELPHRLAEMRAVGKAALISAEAAGRRATLHFRPGAETRHRLEAIVAAESECCAFLEFELDGRKADLALTIQAPEGGEPVLREMVDAFRGAPER